MSPFETAILFLVNVSRKFLFFCSAESQLDLLTLFMKVFFRAIHLYLGLAAGLFIGIACFTGSILVFEEEIQHAFYPNRYFVKATGQQALSPDRLISVFEQQYPTLTVQGIKIYKNSARAWELSVNPVKKGSEKWKGKDAARLAAFVDPYSGSVKEVYNHRESFLYRMMDLHRWLLNGDSGKLIMGISTIIFLFILLTGIILWWPKNKVIFKQRLTFKKNTGWKRINHDLHIVMGFYTAIFLFIFAFTALAWSFTWFNDGIYALTNSSPKPTLPPTSLPGEKKAGVNAILTTAEKTIGEVEYYNIGFPKDSTGVYTVNVLPIDAVHETAIDNHYFDAYSGAHLKSIRFSEKSLGQRVRSTFKPVHTASIWGLPSKIIGFIVCIFGMTFPVTGMIMWFNRNGWITGRKK